MPRGGVRAILYVLDQDACVRRDRGVWPRTCCAMGTGAPPSPTSAPSAFFLAATSSVSSPAPSSPSAPAMPAASSTRATTAAAGSCAWRQRCRNCFAVCSITPPSVAELCATSTMACAASSSRTLASTCRTSALLPWPAPPVMSSAWPLMPWRDMLISDCKRPTSALRPTSSTARSAPAAACCCGEAAAASCSAPRSAKTGSSRPRSTTRAPPAVARDSMAKRLLALSRTTALMSTSFGRARLCSWRAMLGASP